jgi:pimeloyl-ACP methyl ester carboxylesterase
MSKQFPQDQYVKVGDVNTRFWQAGDTGSAVVLVHGLGGSIENWEHNIDALAQQHSVYAVDLLGFGRTDKLPLIKDMNVLVKFLADFLDTQNIEKASLVGSSMGGGLILGFALQFPQKVGKLVLVNNAGMGREVNIIFRMVSVPFFGKLLMGRPSLKSVEKLYKKLVYDPAIITPEMLRVGFELNILPGATSALLSATQAGISIWGQRAKYTKELLSNLDKITTPTLIFWGRQDRIIPVTHAHVAASKIPGARLHIFNNCGHSVMLEYPDEFNKLVLGFLAE